jgi:hypothetical protein
VCRVVGTEWVWPAGAATGVGSLPGTDVGEALRLVFGELPDLPYLPELPGRGPGAELLGRTAGLLVELPVELYSARWRLAGRPGGDLRRTRDFLTRDLDELVGAADGYGGVLKIAAGGPWTLAAGLDLPTGGAVLRDPGARRDLTASLAEGLTRHVAEVSARVPGATVLLQLDEPSLPGVLAGRVATESGFGTYPAVPEADAAEVLRTVIDAAGVPVVVHCCAPDVPVGAIREAGAAGVALDLALLPASAAGLDPLGEALDAGLGLLAGAVPIDAVPIDAVPTDAVPIGTRPDDAAAADAVRRLWHRLGLPAARLPAQVVVTQSCGLAGLGADAARAALRAGRDAARRLADQPE